MARLHSQSKLLYYPTLDWIARRIASYFTTTARRVRLVDPCCGTGKALRDIAGTLPKTTEVEVLGIEMSYARALEAQKVLDRVLPVSFYNVAGGTSFWSQHSVGLLYNNPPYDWSGFDETIEGTKRRVRHETLFLTMSTPKVQPGGHHVLVIPRGMLGDKAMLGAGMEGRIARHLLGWYEHVEIYRYPDPEYDLFKQVVVFAARKRGKYVIPQKEAVDGIVALANPDAEIPVLMEGTGQFLIPEAGEARFEYVPVNPVDLIDHARHFSPLGNEEYLRAVHVRTLGEPFTPAMPINIGHLTLLLAGNETGTLELFDEATGQHLLLKGSSRKITRAENTPNVNDRGEVTSYKVVTKESHASTLSVTKQNGEVLQFIEPREVAEWVTRFGAQLGDAVLTKNKPEYEFDPTPREWELSGMTALGLPPLPGREERGLFDVQRHFAIAVARVLARRRQAILNCEMGFGKAQPLDAKVLTPTGWTTMQQIKVGDLVIGANGHSTQVVGVYPQGEKEIYRVTFSDDSSTECCDDHLWTINTPMRKWRGQPAKTMQLREIRHSLQHKNGNAKFYIPMVEPVKFDETHIPLDPYFLGLLLGDGCLNGGTPQISSADEEILNAVRDHMPKGLFLRQNAKKYTYRISGKKHSGPNPLTMVLSDLGVWEKRSKEKFIPDIYKFSSSETRLAILQGLLDTDGSSCGGTNVEFSSTSRLLAEDVVFLVQSLGGIAKIFSCQPSFTYKGEKRKGQPAYRVIARFPVGIKPFRLSRKLATYVQRTKYADIPRAIKKVEYAGKKLAQCIKVANPDGLYVTLPCR